MSESNELEPEAPRHGPDSAGSAALNSPPDGPSPVVVADQTSDEPENAVPRLPFSIVGVGASAGGVEAYVELMSHLPPDTGMSYVLVSHLAPDHVSELPAIISRHTSMPVREIQTGVAPEPNRVYILPQNVRAILQDGVFKVEPRPSSDRIPMPIDRFFYSLAAEQRNRAIGIILSGSDSDGALGLKAIKGEGGIAIVQDPESARFREMPRSGILADHVDLILAPAAIASELSRIGRQVHQPSLQMLEEGQIASNDEPHFARILSVLRTIVGIDFRNYKPGTLRRRIARRMALRRVETLPDYARLVHESREELVNLHEDVLINVTRFFRDPSVYETLQKEVLPLIFDNRSPDQQVRIWVAGCSTGEEAYSIAICLLEYLAGQAFEPPIQIFGTDASDSSIDKARIGLYPSSIATEVSASRLRRYFLKTDHGYQVHKRVRDLCIFARQNLCNDPPFARLDLISCRNVLIYLKPEVQRSVLNTFHYALKSSGTLLLGRSESVAETLGFFSPVDRRKKFYSKSGDSGPQHLMEMPRTVVDIARPAPHVPSRSRSVALDTDLKRASDRIVLSRYAPPGALVNAELDVIEIRGYPAPFLVMSPGAPSLNLLRMANAEIVPALRSAVRRCIDTGAVVTDEVAVREGPQSVQQAMLEVLPVESGSSPNRYCLVLFVKQGAVSLRDDVPLALPESVDESQRELVRLQRDLASTRVYLQALIEERDSRNQELTAAYEEIQSANEELQSTNEELETAKEELQSTNEELQTFNDELRNRNQALLQAGNDLSNLLNSVNIPVVMMASDLTIRQFTPPAERVMNLRTADIGRPIGDVRLNLANDDIEPLLREVLDTLITKEMEVQDRSGKWHLLRLRPYRTTDNKIDGVVLLLLDIDQMRRAQETVLQAHHFAQSVLEAVQVPVVVLDDALRVRTANAAFRALSGLTFPDLDGRAFTGMLARLWQFPDLTETFRNLLGRADSESLEVEHEVTVPPNRNFRLVATRAVLAGGQPAVLVVLDDITAQRQAERLLESDRERLAGQVRSTAEVLGRTREELRALAGRLFNSQEEERRRVARELHDDINQKLAAVGMDIERMRVNPPADPSEAQSALLALRDRIGGLSEEVRGLSHRLHPAALEHFGLTAALRTLVDEFGEREGMVVTFRRLGEREDIPVDTAVALYRVAQEALRNVAKHAGKTHVRVTLEDAPEGLRFFIRDLGDGFDMDDSHRGLGLVSMEERVRLIGGRFSIESQLGEGTTVAVTVPLPPAPAE